MRVYEQYTLALNTRAETNRNPKNDVSVAPEKIQKKVK